MLENATEYLFEAVARLIVEPTPEWLVEGLEHFAEGIADIARTTTDERQHYQVLLSRMDDAAELLLRYLPLFDHPPFGARDRSGDVTKCLEALPRVAQLLRRAQREPQPGRKPMVERELGAAVVVEAWRLVHGHVPQRSDQLMQACNEYWRACGCREIGATGHMDNSRRYIERACKADRVWIRSALLDYRERG
jgi:hypothetical protein